jgi:uncharacterized protein YjbI with pentapeptide repeats
MANKQHTEALALGLHAWNSWRQQNPSEKPDLSGVDLQAKELDYFDLRDTDLRGANLSGVRAINSQFDRANLTKAQLIETRMPDTSFVGANLADAKLSGSELTECDFTDAQMDGTHFTKARLIGARFSRAYLRLAELIGADLRQADMRNAVLSSATLTGSNLQQALLDGTEFGGAYFGNTIFADTNLGGSQGLETCNHKGPSSIDVRTLARSGDLPLAFLRGCGLSDTFIDYLPSLLTQAIQFYSCFISYSATDDLFVRKLYADLQIAGVRCWFAPDDMRIGDKIRDRIEQSIRVHDKLLIVLSRSSINSSWVESEVEAAMEQEQRKNTAVLFPIRLDEEVMHTDKGWAANIRRSRHVGDFQNWATAKAYGDAFQRLLRDLRGSGIVATNNTRDDFDDDIPF